MTLAIELSGEHPELARAEASAVVETLGGQVQATWDRVLLADGPLDPLGLADRIALGWRVLEVAGTTTADAEAIGGLADQVPLDGQRFAVRCSRLSTGLPSELPGTVERWLGARLVDRGQVDLTDPEVTVRVLIEEDRALVGIEAAEIDRAAYQARHPEERPFFSPVSTHPRLARAQVNLARARPGSRVWDPFCGTGGLVLETALAGYQAIGSDLDPGMIAGTRENLAAFEAEAELVEGDVAEVADRLDPVAAVVTDPPYGRSSTTHREDLAELYARFFAAAEQVLEPGGRVVVVLPDRELGVSGATGFELVEEHAWKVHGSLTRHLLVFRPA